MVLTGNILFYWDPFRDNAVVIFLTCEARRRISGKWLHFLARLKLFHERIVTKALSRGQGTFPFEFL